ncbi:PF06792 family protein [Treponema socranskii subsp. socranskii VPI DR56BR1116 = ATCC 35536]|uniref:PF06792 family protein n=1 Tax=Treponema socranskii subsp. socranskii VPI DR56BR1116 = ATCC 35536 TaxID=1125725 RepID=U2KXI5_TRESO|nr:Tm-1-like ATP-binding domain-containing protein [Treponema socranskii]ERF60601.1 PF06792 family protein [Treponema socranskii subsp. socranskii VPI DR56BR1116 = ATCC 35536]ERK03167.1 PF06792 family protein [Treponema socranskii subsp. socranskii VPI DR56BR1116 = ATCC 35536]
MRKKIALIASLDTKLNETLFAKKEIESCGCEGLIIDISAKTVLDAGAEVTPVEILKRYGMEWKDFDLLGKADRIETMSKALNAAVFDLYREGLFDAVISIGGGQNARMAAAAMKALPFGVPKIVASSLACGKRTMEQYVGDKDIMVVHTVADISGLNEITKTVIYNVCHAVIGMLEHRKPIEKDIRKKVAATMLGITCRGTEGVLRRLPDDSFEKICFHANGTGGRCMESLIREGKFDLVLDMTLHEITCELFGGYCTGAPNRLTAAIENNIPMVVVPGALDMLDFFIDEDGKGLPDDIDSRKKVFHNASICHTKIRKNEALRLAQALADRLNRAEMPVTLVLPDGGFCEAAAVNGPMYDSEVDKTFIETIKSLLKKEIRVVDVHGNINDEAVQEVIAKELIHLA